MSTEYYLRVDRVPSLSFSDLFSRPKPVARTSWGGDARGCVVELLRPLADDVELVSQYGDLMTVGTLRALDGGGRREG